MIKKKKLKKLLKELLKNDYISLKYMFDMNFNVNY